MKLQSKRRLLAPFVFLLLFIILPLSIIQIEVAREHRNEALLDAIHKNDARQVNVLLKDGADPNVRVNLNPMTAKQRFLAVWNMLRGWRMASPGNGPTALMLALSPERRGQHSYTYNGIALLADPYSAPRKVSIIHDPAIARMLLKAGAKVGLNEADWDGRTPLMWASLHGYTDVVESLLRLGAKWDVSDRHGQLPIMFAETGDHQDVVLRLLACGSNPNARDHAQRTLLMYAAKHNDTQLLNLLVVHGADVNAKDTGGSRSLSWAATYEPRNVLWLVQAGAKLEARHYDRTTAIHWPAYMGNVRGVKALLDAGADPNTPGINGKTPLMLVAYNGYANIARLLLAHGANVNPRTPKGETALAIASQAKQVSFAALLRKAGATE